MQCPKCVASPLNPTTLRAIQVDRCGRCHGIWFDERELSALLAEDPRTLRPLAGGKERDEHSVRRGDCPRDGTAMLRVFSTHNRDVVLDTCPSCRGIWLDGGELAALLPE